MARISKFKRKGSVEVSGATTKREEDQSGLGAEGFRIEGASRKREEDQQQL